jgi:predicted permease
MMVITRLLSHLRRNRLDDEQAEEIAQHIELRRQSLVDDGMDPREAEWEARRQFGNVAGIQEETRDLRIFPALDTIVRDVQYGWRVIMKSPGFSAVAIVSLAVGIGASSVIFSFANAFLFRPLPGTHPSPLMRVFTSNASGPLYGSCSYPDYQDLRDRTSVFSDLLAYRRAKATLSDSGQSAMMPGALVSANYFGVLGLRPSLGRFFLPEENRSPGTHAVVVLSDDAWRRRFGSDPHIVGRTIGLNGHGFTVVGIGPRNFAGISFDEGAEFFVPVMMERAISPGADTLRRRRDRGYTVLGRLQTGGSPAEAGTAVRLLASQLFLQYPLEWRNNRGLGRTFTVLPEIEARFAGAPEGTWLGLFSGVMAGAVVLLGIACVNVAMVLLARAAARRKEIAVRLALGASRRRVVRQLLTECALLAAAGGALGLVVAQWAAALVATWRPAEVPALDLTLDYRVVLFTAGASILTLFLFGLAPALQTTRPDVNAELNDRTSPVRIRRFRFGLRDGIVIVQVTVSFVLVVGAALMLRSAWTGLREDPGFRRDGIFNVKIDLSTTTGDADSRNRFYRAAVESVTALPGVEHAALAALVPLDGSNRTMAMTARADALMNDAVVDVNVVGPGYFRLLDTPVVQGREFSPDDREGAPLVAVVNETMARRFWGDTALGKVFARRDLPGDIEVVGVVRDVRNRSLAESVIPIVFFPAGQSDEARMTLHVRTSAPPRLVAESVHRVLHELDPTAGLSAAETMTEFMQFVTLPQRLGGAGAAAAAVLELSLVAMALYGVIAYTTTQRTREIGLRIALGASSRSVARLIVMDGLALAGVGIAVGMAGALAAGPLVESGGLLIGVSPIDPISFGVACVVLLTVACGASYLPARRALRVDPATALRSE